MREKHWLTITRHWQISIWLLAFLLAAGPATAAEQKKSSTKAPHQQGNQQQSQPAPPAPQVQGPPLPDAYKLNLLIRSSIIALNQANQTGNYTVLQDLAAPAFRASNNSVRLAQIFSALRQRQLDLTPVLFFTPKLIAQPQIAPNGLLRLAGYFPTAPERVNFDLIYQIVDGQWRLFGIGVTTSPAEVTSAVPPAGGPAEPAQGGGATSEAAQAAPTVTPAQNAAEAHEAPAVPTKAEQKREGGHSGRTSQAEGQSNTRKTNSRASGTAEKAPARDEDKVVSGSTNDAARIDLAHPGSASTGEPAQAAKGTDEPDAADGSPKKQQSLWESFNLFGSD